MRRFTILFLFFTSLLLAPVALASAPSQTLVHSHQATCQPELNSDSNATVYIQNITQGNATAVFNFSGISSSRGFFIELPNRATIQTYRDFGHGVYGEAYWNSSWPYAAEFTYQWQTGVPEKTGSLTYNVNYVSGSNWRLIPIPRSGDVDLQVKVDNGSSAGSYAFVGPHTTGTSQLNSCEQLTMITGPDINDSRSELISSIRDTSQYVQFGIRHETLNSIVYPGSAETYGGIAVRDIGKTMTLLFQNPEQGARPYTTGFVASHEYVHSRQGDWRLGPNVLWLKEATANYYAIESLYSSGHLSYADWKQLHYDWGKVTENATLANISSWGSHTPYTRGLHVVRELDQRIRSQTNGTHSLQTVLQSVESNRQITWRDLNSSVVAVAGNSTGEWLRQVVFTSQVPSSASTGTVQYYIGRSYWNAVAALLEIHAALLLTAAALFGIGITMVVDGKVLPVILGNESKQYDLRVGSRVFKLAVLFESAYFWVRQKAARATSFLRED